jgi:hypothetical protein
VSKEKPKNISASVRQRLLNLARERNDEFQLVLVRYGIERLLYRLSVSPHGKQFVLKGAMLFQLWTGQPHRSTFDVDLLGSGDYDVERLVTTFKEVSSQGVADDGLVFQSGGVIGGLIREDQRYGGVRIQMTAMLDNARIPIQIDIGFGDAITPKASGWSIRRCWISRPRSSGPTRRRRRSPRSTRRWSASALPTAG